MQTRIFRIMVAAVNSMNKFRIINFFICEELVRNDWICIFIAVNLWIVFSFSDCSMACTVQIKMIAVHGMNMTRFPPSRAHSSSIVKSSSTAFALWSQNHRLILVQPQETLHALPFKFSASKPTSLSGTRRHGPCWISARSLFHKTPTSTSRSGPTWKRQWSCGSKRSGLPTLRPRATPLWAPAAPLSAEKAKDVQVVSNQPVESAATAIIWSQNRDMTSS